MTLDIAVTMVLYAVIFFFAGIGWGQWWNERQIRKEQKELVKGRVTVSMPLKPEVAAATMKSLVAFIEEVDKSDW
jgi:hypothetical protein